MRQIDEALCFTHPVWVLRERTLVNVVRSICIGTILKGNLGLTSQFYLIHQKARVLGLCPGKKAVADHQFEVAESCYHAAYELSADDSYHEKILKINDELA